MASGSVDTLGARVGRVAGPVNDVLTRSAQRLETAVEGLPGSRALKGVIDGVLGSVGIVSPHARRAVVYAGAGLLGVVGVIEWPVAVAGAAVVWLTQPLANAPVVASGHSRPVQSETGRGAPETSAFPAEVGSSATSAATAAQDRRAAPAEA
ncbi:hypothetical protein [Actinacidiphila sp. bgisy167]|uniref:hypothetical protein n=1 Tax=Actinacidiphila sp. bgisy167 TaxID=3413797 RepID=UPI003D74FE23